MTTRPKTTVDEDGQVIQEEMVLDLKPCEEHGYNCPDLPECQQQWGRES